MGDALEARRAWPALLVAVAANYALTIGRAAHWHRWFDAHAAEATSLREQVSTHLVFGHLWAVVILLAALASRRGHPWLALAAGSTTLIGPFALDLGRHGRVFTHPLCCTGVAHQTPWVALLEVTAMLAMVAVVAVAARRTADRIGVRFRVAAAGMVSAVAIAVATWLWLVQPDGRLDSYTTAAIVAAVLLGLGLGAGQAPWFIAVMPALWLLGVLPLHTRHDLAVGAVLLVASLAWPTARRLEAGWISANPSTHGGPQPPLVSTTN